MLKTLWNWILSVFKPKPDPRPDPEDPIVYAHVNKLLWSFDHQGTGQVELADPFQLLRDRARKPTDVVKGWGNVREELTAIPLPHPVGYGCWVDVYEGPRGSGFVVNYETTRNAVIFRKAINIGPEEWREQDWTETAPVLPPDEPSKSH